MRRDGYIRNDSARGVWEITDAGRKWLDDHKRLGIRMTGRACFRPVNFCRNLNAEKEIGVLRLARIAIPADIQDQVLLLSTPALLHLLRPLWRFRSKNRVR